MDLDLVGDRSGSSLLMQMDSASKAGPVLDKIHIQQQASGFISFQFALGLEMVMDYMLEAESVLQVHQDLAHHNEFFYLVPRRNSIPF